MVSALFHLTVEHFSLKLDTLSPRILVAQYYVLP